MRSAAFSKTCLQAPAVAPRFPRSRCGRNSPPAARVRCGRRHAPRCFCSRCCLWRRWRYRCSAPERSSSGTFGAGSVIWARKRAGRRLCDTQFLQSMRQRGFTADSGADLRRGRRCSGARSALRVPSKGAADLRGAASAGRGGVSARLVHSSRPHSSSKEKAIKRGASGQHCPDAPLRYKEMSWGGR